MSTIEQLREHFENPRTIHWWGQDHTVTPRVAEFVSGDGKTLLALCPLMERPNYYVVRVDSRWFGDDDEYDLYDHIDEIYEAIEEEFGPARCGYCADRFGQNEADCEGCHDAKPEDGWFPRACFYEGSSWYELKWPTGETETQA